MPDDLTPPAPPAEFVDLLNDLRQLTRAHNLFYRDQVGQRMLGYFFAGSVAAYLTQDPYKEASFLRFQQTCATYLDGFGLGKTVLRNCILCHIVLQTLPQELRERLEFSHVVALTRVEDSTLRARLGRESVDQGWPVKKLREVIGLAEAGLWYDADDATPGTQAPEPPEPEAPKPQLGRLVSKAERFAEQLTEFTGQWRAVDRKPTKAEDARLRAAVAIAEQELAEIKKFLR